MNFNLRMKDGEQGLIYWEEKLGFFILTNHRHCHSLTILPHQGVENLLGQVRLLMQVGMKVQLKQAIGVGYQFINFHFEYSLGNDTVMGSSIFEDSACAHGNKVGFFDPWSIVPEENHSALVLFVVVGSPRKYLKQFIWHICEEMIL